MSRWIVRLLDGSEESIVADSMYINPAAGLWFSIAKTVDPTPEPAPPVAKRGKKPYVRKRPELITVRAFNSHEWRDVRLVE